MASFCCFNVNLMSVMQNEDNNGLLAYWLSNTSNLLFLLQRSLKAAGAGGGSPRQKPSPATSLFGRMTQVWIHLFHPCI